LIDASRSVKTEVKNQPIIIPKIISDKQNIEKKCNKSKRKIEIKILPEEKTSTNNKSKC